MRSPRFTHRHLCQRTLRPSRKNYPLTLREGAGRCSKLAKALSPWWFGLVAISLLLGCSPGPESETATDGWATRYWDCCKPACGWRGNVSAASAPVTSCSAQNQSLGADYEAPSACESGGTAFMCHDYGPWAVSETLAYGFAAVNRGSEYCGQCYELAFTGASHSGSNDPGAQGLAGKTLVVQAINTGGIAENQFDILIPGGGVGDFDACSTQWATTDLGERYGGFHLACQKASGFDYATSRECTRNHCQRVFGDKPGLLAGCHFFVDWFGAADNPSLRFKPVDCPPEISAKSGLTL